MPDIKVGSCSTAFFVFLFAFYLKKIDCKNILNLSDALVQLRVPTDIFVQECSLFSSIR